MLSTDVDDLASLLELGPRVDNTTNLRLRWSQDYIQTLETVRATSKQQNLGPGGFELAGEMLLCNDGLFQAAETSIIGRLLGRLDQLGRDPEELIDFIVGFFTVQRFDILAALLKARYGYGRKLELSRESDSPGLGRVRWEISGDGTHKFHFSDQAFLCDKTKLEILSFQWEFPVFSNYSWQNDQENGTVYINLQDVGQTPGLSFCSSLPEYFLIPDNAFIPSKGYAYVREVLEAERIDWDDRQPVAFWRGATTGLLRAAQDWRSLERVKLCMLGQRPETQQILDVGLSEIKQIDDPTVIGEIKQSGLVKGPIPWRTWSRYKYLIEIDGNCNSWSNFFQRLLSGSTMLKVGSYRGLTQWFQAELRPWINYVPIAPDMSDLVDKIRWLQKNDVVAKQIGRAGLSLAEQLTYDSELQKSVEVISSAYRYHGGKEHIPRPFGLKFKQEV